MGRHSEGPTSTLNAWIEAGSMGRHGEQHPKESSHSSSLSHECGAGRASGQLERHRARDSNTRERSTSEAAQRPALPLQSPVLSLKKTNPSSGELAAQAVSFGVWQLAVPPVLVSPPADMPPVPPPVPLTALSLPPESVVPWRPPPEARLPFRLSCHLLSRPRHSRDRLTNRYWQRRVRPHAHRLTPAMAMNGAIRMPSPS